MNHPIDHVTLTLTVPNAMRLARLLRNADQDVDIATISELGFELGAHLGMTSDSDDSDPVDEFLDEGDTIALKIDDCKVEVVAK